MTDNSELSVITVCLNAVESIQTCMESVKRQLRHADIEHIIVDGGSSDGTLDMIEQYRQNHEHIRVAVGRDEGIYDAMNKGIGMATAPFVATLNSDDYYTQDRGTRMMLDFMRDSRAACAYADLDYVDNSGKVVRRWRSKKRATRISFLCGWMPPHPTFFAQRSLFKDLGGYRLDLGTAADYELMLRYLYRYRLPYVYVPISLVNMRLGGESNKSLACRVRAHAMDYKAWFVNRLVPLPTTLLMKPLRKVPQFLT